MSEYSLSLSHLVSSHPSSPFSLPTRLLLPQTDFPLPSSFSSLLSPTPPDPITSLTPSPTSPATLLVSTLDSHLRLLDRTNGKVLASFAGHVNTEYRSKASFAYGEGSVVCGDEEGRVWAWGVMNVSETAFVSSWFGRRTDDEGLGRETREAVFKRRGSVRILVCSRGKGRAGGSKRLIRNERTETSKS